jgi:hypothetical protein
MLALEEFEIYPTYTSRTHSGEVDVLESKVDT